MTYIVNNIKYTTYSDGVRVGDDTSVEGNAVDGILTNLDLVIPSEIEGKSVLRIGKDSFHGLKLKSISLPNTLLELGKHSFDKCYIEVDELVLPESLTSIGECAFSGNLIRSFAIGENVKTIEYGVFSDNTALESIRVSENNPYFLSNKGVLFNKNKTTLYCIPYLVDGFKIPFTVTTIMKRAICQCYATTIWIPQSVTRLDYQAFFLIPNTRTIHILGNMESINENFIYKKSENLQSIYYHGAKVFNKTAVLKTRQEINFYVCNEYDSEYFAQRKVLRFGSCYSYVRTCKCQQKSFHISYVLYNIA